MRQTKNIVVAKTMYVCDKKKACRKSEACKKGLCNHTSDPKHTLYSDHPYHSFTHRVDPATTKITIWEAIRDENEDSSDNPT